MELMNMQIDARDEKLQQCGIYKIQNNESGHFYIGSAKHFYRRAYTHKNQLESGKHHTIALQRAWNLHGASAFTFEPLLVCAKNDLLFYEQLLIDGLKPKYNSAPTAGSMLGFKHREESLWKMAKSSAGEKASFKGRKHTQETKDIVSKKRSKFDEDTVKRVLEMLDNGVSQREVSRIMGMSQSSVSNINIGIRYKDITSGRVPARDKIKRMHTAESRAKISQKTKRLCDDQVREIRARAVAGEPYKLIAQSYGVTAPTISRVIRKIDYADVI